MIHELKTGGLEITVFYMENDRLTVYAGPESRHLARDGSSLLRRVPGLLRLAPPTGLRNGSTFAWARSIRSDGQTN